MEREFELAVTWWPYELHPEIPPGGVPVEALATGSRLSAQYRDYLKEYAAEADITLASKRIVSNSHRALELAEFARDRGRFQAVHDRLFAAYFEEGLDIGDETVLAEIASGAGLDAAEWQAEMVAGRYRDLVNRTTQIARERGFTSTPTMVFDDRFMIPGAQDMIVYRDVLRRMGATPRESEESPGT